MAAPQPPRVRLPESSRRLPNLREVTPSTHWATRRGAQPSLPTRRELLAFATKAK